MTNLTIALDEAIVRQARIRAIEQGTSLSAKIREFLAAYAAGTSQRESGDATTDLLRMIDDVRAEAHQNAAAASEPAASKALRRKSMREELYEGDFRARARIESAWPTASGLPPKNKASRT